MTRRDPMLSRGFIRVMILGLSSRAQFPSALEQTHGVQVKAADVLGISYRSFRHLMKKYEL